MAAGWQRALLAPTPDARRAGVLRACCALWTQRYLHGEGRGLAVGGSREAGPLGGGVLRARKGEVTRATRLLALRRPGRQEAKDLLALTQLGDGGFRMGAKAKIWKSRPG